MATQAQIEISPRIQTPKPALKAKKKLIRRTDRDRSQITRRIFQAAFLLLNLALGTQFYFWVRQFEAGGAQNAISRPAGVEGWLPIAALMNLKYLRWEHSRNTCGRLAENFFDATLCCRAGSISPCAA